MPKKDDATHSGVSAAETDAERETREEQEQQQRQREPSLREMGMDMMVQRRREQLEQEGVLEAEPPADEDEEAKKKREAEEAAAREKKDDETEDQLAAAREEQAAADKAAVEAEEARQREEEETRARTATGDQQMVTIKIDGQEEQVPLSKLVANYQKGGAADKRLEEATKLLEEAKATRESATTAKEKKAAEEEVEQAQANLDARIKDLTDAMYAGDEKKVAETFRKAVKESVDEALKGRDAKAGATPSTEEIIAQVTPAVEQSLALKGALKKFQADFPRIAKDPYLAKRADAFLNDELAAGRPYDVAFKNAGDRTLGWMRETLGIKDAVTTSTARTDKTGKKEEIDNPASTSARVPSEKEAPIEGNASETITKMREARVGSG